MTPVYHRFCLFPFQSAPFSYSFFPPPPPLLPLLLLPPLLLPPLPLHPSPSLLAGAFLFLAGAAVKQTLRLIARLTKLEINFSRCSLSLSISLSLSLSFAFISLSIYLYVSVSIQLPMSVSIYVPVSLTLSQSIYPSIYSACPPTSCWQITSPA